MYQSAFGGYVKNRQNEAICRSVELGNMKRLKLFLYTSFFKIVLCFEKANKYVLIYFRRMDLFHFAILYERTEKMQHFEEIAGVAGCQIWRFSNC